jgi:hypothetical protein
MKAQTPTNVPATATPSTAGTAGATSPDTLAAAEQQRQKLLDAQREANSGTPRNFKEDALTNKVVSIEPDGTGPTPTETLDPEEDQRRGSGSGKP